MRRLLIALVLLTLSLTAAAPPLIIPPALGLTNVEITWTAVPTSTDIGIAETVWLDHLAFSTAGTARTVTVADRAGSPVTVINAVSLAANQFTLISMGGVRLTNGFTLSASGAGVVYQFRGRVRR